MRNPNDQGRTITHIPIVDHGTYREQCPTRCLFSKGSQQGPTRFQQNFPVLGHVGSMWVRMNDSWWFQTCSKKMIPVPIVPDISVITPTERHIFLFWGMESSTRVFPRTRAEFTAFMGFLMQPLHRVSPQWVTLIQGPTSSRCDLPHLLVRSTWRLRLISRGGSTPFYRHEPGTLQYNDNV